MSRRILLCISGSIAAYKAADLVSLLRKQGHDVQCLLTRSASEFVTPTVLETLSGRPALGELFGPTVSGTEHIRLARWAELVVFAPASAHLLARLALGMADDLVTTVALATTAPWLVAPAMNPVMWNKSETGKHIETLRARGAAIVEPGAGVLACGEEGIGKLAAPEVIARAIETRLATLPAAPEHAEVALGLPEARPRDLAGTRVLITAGPTISRIDAVRYMTNPSTGRMGAALAEEALARGAEVFYILGVDKGVVRPRVPADQAGRFHLHEVETAEEMREAALARLPLATGVIASAAVLDYRVESPLTGKQKRASVSISLGLVPSADVLGSLRDAATPGQWFMGFAAETDDLETHARAKLAKKRLNLLFANRVARIGERLASGFGSESNSGLLFRATQPGAAPEEFGSASKSEIARRLWDVIRAELVG